MSCTPLYSDGITRLIMFCSLLLYAVIPASVNPVYVATLSDTSQLKYSELVAGSGVGVGS